MDDGPLRVVVLTSFVILVVVCAVALCTFLCSSKALIR